ncbi:MAG: hypothetical protein HY661_08645 [Betaproteobacteria bacterium]|nr:hypothetical protein [Betaproteobacteria bacterium]
MNTYARSLYAIFLIVITSLLAACGGGGGTTEAPVAPVAPAASTLITGTAAAGAPVVGFVSVRDGSTNPQPVRTNIPIAADGKYTVDVNGLTAPFAFLATGEVGGKRVELYSTATQADVGGTINITPFTDLIVRNVAGTVAGTLVDAYLASGKLSTLTAAQVDAERVKLTATLSPVLQAAGLAASIDLMRATFNADGTGLDRVMDVVKVDTTVPTAITITNLLDAANKLTINPQTGTTTGGTVLSATGVTTAATPTPIDLIRQTFADFSALFATALPDPADPRLTALIASTFLDNGENSGAFLTDITTDPELKGMKFGDGGLVVDSIDTATGIAKVSFVPVSATGSPLVTDAPGNAIHWQMKKVGTAWLIDGNQRIADVRVRATAGRNVCSVGNFVGCTSKSATGLSLDVFNHGLQAIGSAVFKGPGLPAAGVTLTAQANNSQLFLASFNVSPSLYELDDATIATLGANGSYTVELYDNAATPVLLATYTEVVPVAPVLNTALATLAFPEVGGMVDLVGFTQGTLLPTWTIPAGLTGDTISVNVFQTANDANGANQHVDYDIIGKGATGTANMVITLPATGVWSSGSYWIQAWDANFRKVYTNYQQ